MNSMGQNFSINAEINQIIDSFPASSDSAPDEPISSEVDKKIESLIKTIELNTTGFTDETQENLDRLGNILYEYDEDLSQKILDLSETLLIQPASQDEPQSLFQIAFEPEADDAASTSEETPEHASSNDLGGVDEASSAELDMDDLEGSADEPETQEEPSVIEDLQEQSPLFDDPITIEQQVTEISNFDQTEEVFEPENSSDTEINDALSEVEETVFLDDVIVSEQFPVDSEDAITSPMTEGLEEVPEPEVETETVDESPSDIVENVEAASSSEGLEEVEDVDLEEDSALEELSEVDGGDEEPDIALETMDNSGELALLLNEIFTIEHSSKYTHEAAYASVTRHFSSSQQQYIAKLARESSKEIQELVAAAEEGDLKHPIFSKQNIENFPLLALAAYKEDLLALGDFSAIMEYWSALKYHPEEEIIAYKLFKDDGSIDLDVKAMLQKTMQFKNPEATELFKTNVLSEEQFAKFYEELSSLSSLQKQYWTVNDLDYIQEDSLDDLIPNPLKPFHPFLKMLTGQTSIKKSIVVDTGVNTFNEIDNNRRIIPPLSLIQAFLNAKHTNPVELDIILGAGNALDLHQNGLDDSRIVSLAFPLPEFDDFDRADGFMVLRDYNMTFHDAVYHADVVSTIPPLHRRLYIYLADAVAKVSKQPKYAKDRDIQEISKRFYNRIVDMEFDNYRQKEGMDDLTCFVTNVAKVLPESCESRYIIYALIDRWKNSDRSLSLKDISVSLAKAEKKVEMLMDKFSNRAYAIEIAHAFVSKLRTLVPEKPLQEWAIQLHLSSKEFVREDDNEVGQNNDDRLNLIDAIVIAIQARPASLKSV